MRILDLHPMGAASNPYSSTGKVYDLEANSKVIKEGIRERFKDVDIFTPVELAKDNNDFISSIRTGDYDFCLCDLTTYNSNITYLAGLIEGVGKPVIYYSHNDHSELPVMGHKKSMLYSEASLQNEFRSALNDEIQKLWENPNTYSTFEKSIPTKPKAFISYSHEDKDYLNRLMVHLKPLERNGVLDIWEDSQLKVGDKWENEINDALENASIAILLISADFLASDFIVNNELPPLLAKAEVKGTRIVPVILNHCRFSREPLLNKFQASNSPNEPLSSMDKNEREAIYDKLALDIENAISEP